MKAIALTVATLAAVAVTGVSAASADVPGLSITRVGYNAVGADTSWNRNQEYVDITAAPDHAVDVKGLVVEDSWAHAAGDDNRGHCNTWTVNSLPGIEPTTEGQIMLPAGHTIRVYTGSGRPAVFGVDGRFHAVYMNSHCGYHGHFWNNGGDTVYVSLNGETSSLAYNFENGYYIR
jgi:hypothetical protein